MLLTSIIAKGLVLIDAWLEYFATAVPASQQNICGTVWTFYNAELTACGQEHILAELMTDLLELRVLPEILAGLFAV